MKPLKWKLILVVFFVQFVLSACLHANPTISPFDRTMDWVLLSLIYGYVFLIETTAIKFILYGRDGPSWLRAFMVAVFVNALSAVAGIFTHVYYHVGSFDFYPNFISVYGMSLGVESLTLLLMYMRSYPKRAFLTGIVMNTASYLFFLMLSFPK